MNKKSGRYIKNIFSLPPVYIFLFQKILRQKRFINTHLKKELYPYSIITDGSLKEADLKKITSYYSLGVTAVLGESFCVLRGQKMHPRERLCISFLGGISGLLDDLFDEPDKEADHLFDFILKPEGLKPANLYEKLILHFYELGLQYSSHPALIKSQAIKVFESQKASVNQQQVNVSLLDVEEMTYSKGGCSFLYYRLCLNHQLQPEEEKFVYELGGLMQLGNDIFDVWEDHQNGIKTIATLCTDINYLREKFSSKYSKCFSLARKTPYPEKNIRRFENICSLALARVDVCLDQFLELQKSSGNIFSINKYSRKELICDMQKPTNQLKAINYYLKKDYKRNYDNLETGSILK